MGAQIPKESKLNLLISTWEDRFGPVILMLKNAWFTNPRKLKHFVKIARKCFAFHASWTKNTKLMKWCPLMWDRKGNYHFLFKVCPNYKNLNSKAKYSSSKD
jgi:hypothetical protein